MLVNCHWWISLAINIIIIDEVKKALFCKLHLKSRVYMSLKGEVKDCFKSTTEKDYWQDRT